MTKIEWTHRPGTTGETWSPITGCTPVSAGCTKCYARRMAKRLAGRFGYPEAPYEFDVTLHPDRLETPFRWRKPRTVFVSSMGDLFHARVSWQAIECIFSVMTAHENRKHTFILLTKRAKRMYEFVSECYPGLDKCSPHIIGMVTAENQIRADERVPWLLKTPFAIRGVSVEPMLTSVRLSQWLGKLMDCPVHGPVGVTHWTTWKGCGLCLEQGIKNDQGRPHSLIRNVRPGIGWIIAGGETGPGARLMNPQWARGLRDQCKAVGVPFFMKQMSKRAPIPPDLQVREWPNEIE